MSFSNIYCSLNILGNSLDKSHVRINVPENIEREYFLANVTKLKIIMTYKDPLCSCCKAIRRTRQHDMSNEILFTVCKTKNGKQYLSYFLLPLRGKKYGIKIKLIYVEKNMLYMIDSDEIDIRSSAIVVGKSDAERYIENLKTQFN